MRTYGKKIDKITGVMVNSLLKNLTNEGEFAYLVDPVSNVIRSRVNAEFCSTLVTLHLCKVKNFEPIIKKLTNWILTKQNADGSWNEIHPNYDKPSSVFTSICGLCLFEVKKNFPSILIKDEVFHNASRYLLEQEISDGYFRKSELYHADIYNADAMIAAFLFRMANKYTNQKYRDAAKRSISNICSHQFENGSFPYGGPERAYPYKYHNHVPCVHYQAVTLYYLIKCLPYFKSNLLEKSILAGTEWLLENQNDNGYFNWTKSGLNFALYLSSTYAFIIPIYIQFQNNNKTEDMILKSLTILENNMFNNILLRWEKSNFHSLMSGLLNALKGGFIGDYPFSYKILRSLHRIQREFARSKISPIMRVSKIASQARGYSAFLSTVESSTNYPDLYMMTEALESLSNAIEKQRLKNESSEAE